MIALWKLEHAYAEADSPDSITREELLILLEPKKKEFKPRLLREYFEKRFHILAVESTTYEILRSLGQTDVDPELRKKIAEVLESADLAKFAKWIPEPGQILQLNQQAKQVVELSRPKEAVNGI